MVLNRVKQDNVKTKIILLWSILRLLREDKSVLWSSYGIKRQINQAMVQQNAYDLQVQITSKKFRDKI